MAERCDPSSELSMAWTQAGDEKVRTQTDLCILSPFLSLSLNGQQREEMRYCCAKAILTRMMEKVDKIQQI